MNRPVFCWLLLFFSFGPTFAHSQSKDNRSLGDIARELREKRSNAAKARAQSGVAQPALADITDPEEYTSEISDLLASRNFEGLENAAATARSRKTRIVGGGWNLYIFYDSVAQPSGNRRDIDWEAQIGILKQWVAKRPDSVTARIALAHAYLLYGEQARGASHANTATDEGWLHFGQRSEQARVLLEQAARLPVKCPFLQMAMLEVATAQHWDKSRTRKLVDQTIAAEPRFYHVYREYANYLQPKWYGSERELMDFANEISGRLGGSEGAFVYFEIATVVGCGFCDGPNVLANFSWPKIKEGYAAMQQMYGVSDLKLNRFAYLAYRFKDKQAAREAFARIGDRWDPQVWTDAQQFDTDKSWAASY